MIMYKIDGLVLDNPYPNERTPSSCSSHSSYVYFIASLYTHPSIHYPLAPTTSPSSYTRSTLYNDEYVNTTVFNRPGRTSISIINTRYL